MAKKVKQKTYERFYMTCTCGAQTRSLLTRMRHLIMDCKYRNTPIKDIPDYGKKAIHN